MAGTLSLDLLTRQSGCGMLKQVRVTWILSKAMMLVAFSPDGRHIVSGSGDKTVRVWDAQTGQSVRDPLKGHDDFVTSVVFSPDGRHIVSGSADKTIRVWDAHTGQSVIDPLKGHDDFVTSVACSPHSKHIVSGSCDKTVRVWDSQTGQVIMNPFTVSPLSCCATSRNPVVFPITYMLSDDGNISMSEFHRTCLCDSYAISLLTFSHCHDNWIMLPDNAHLLWLPDKNKSGFFWPRTITVIGCTPTSLQLKNFVHGVNWSTCFSSLHDPI